MGKARVSFLVSVFILITISCYSQRNNYETDFNNYETECMGTGKEGTQLLKVWVYTKKPQLAPDLAKKCAIHTIIFKGIPAGMPGCIKYPLINYQGAEIKYQNYFRSFFSKGGQYLKFVAFSNDGTIEPNDRLRIDNQYKIGVMIVVNHAALRKELESAGIIKPLGDGF